jgi:signal transduction histidine kinase
LTAEPTLNERIVSGLAHGVLVLDADGRIQTANPAASALLGLAGGSRGDAVPPVLSGVAARALAGPAGTGTEVVQVADEGDSRAVAVQWAPLPGGPGVLLTVVDLAPLQALTARERTRGVLSGIGRLTSHMAHELKNPLGALKLYALLLSKQLREERPEVRELAEKIARSVDHLSTLVSGLTGYGPPASLDLAPVELAGVADGALAAVDPYLRAAEVDVARRYAPAPVTVPADARALGQALGVFLRNAAEAMPRGGTLTVGVAAGPGGAGEVTVGDTGPGMSREALARLFEPFSTTKDSAVGLGMSMARQVIERHGGRVEVTSQPGAGTTVRVVVPGRRGGKSDG